ncbi:MAG: bifunctional indole-3-glycerol-phosphate synthase TrpC/phosphoribosylanthranilate isomerase TrpF [Polyangiaceae bacterium]
MRDKREAVAARMAARPLAELTVAPSDRDFTGALRRAAEQGRTAFILECKQASPSQGVLRPSFDPTAIATRYAPFADAISVLCDTPYFGGDLAHLALVRDAAPQPVLCKDFVVDPYQVDEARAHGADAILLMASVLDQPTLARCHARCRALGMGALVEVHDADELDRAIALGAEVIGINNRNLADLSIDLTTTERLAASVPRTTLTISESGIRDHHDIVRLRDRVQGFLIGSALMREPDLDAAIRRVIFGPTKICGLTAATHAAAAHAAGATHGGLVLWPRSPRAVTLDDAPRLVAAAPLAWVGVFVDEPAERIAAIARDLDLSAVQLHGDQPDAFLAALRAAGLPDGCAIWRAHRVADTDALPARFAELQGPADRLLLDAYDAALPGGTGRAFDWQTLAAHPDRGTIWLSGGIRPENVVRADALGCHGLDLSSGVERRPGDKDLDRLEALFALRRSGESKEAT